MTPSFTESETWALERIRAGKVAKFQDGVPGSNDRGEGRNISAAFLREILSNEEFLRTIPAEGVRISGARFTEELSLTDGHLPRQLWLEQCRFDKPIDLSGQTIDGPLSFAGSIIAAPLDNVPGINLDNTKIDGTLFLNNVEAEGVVSMNGSHVCGDLFMRGEDGQIARFSEVDLSNARIDGQLDFESVIVEGELTMNGLCVREDLFLRLGSEQSADLAELDLSNAEIKGRVEISGKAEGKLTMRGLHVAKDLLIGKEKWPTNLAVVDLTAAEIEGQLRIEDASVERQLIMNGIRVGQDLMMNATKARTIKFATIDLANAKVGGQLSFESVTITGFLDMKNLKVCEHLLMESRKRRPSKFGTMGLSGARVDGDLSLAGASVTGALLMTGLHVGRNLYMGGNKGWPSEFASADLSNAEVAGHFLLDDATIHGAFSMDRLHVGRDLSMQRIRCSGDGVTASLRYIWTDGKLDLEDAEYVDLDLAGSMIKGELRLIGMKSPTKVRLSLKNAHATVLHDSELAWPHKRELAGFTYDRLGGVGTQRDETGGTSVRSIKWYVNWLEPDSNYSPQPYEQLAEVLRKAGEPALAGDVLYAGRERARRLAPWWRYIGMTLLKWTIGYGLGLRYFRCLRWIGGLTIVGVILLQADATVALWHGLGSGGSPSILDSAVYSLQKLIPFVEFEKFEQVRLGAVAKLYFYLHKAAGYVLALFLGAGLSGLTQKS